MQVCRSYDVHLCPPALLTHCGDPRAPAGVMDPDTKVISDPRRVLNADETPQPVDAPQKGRRKKVAKRKGQAVRKATATSKENASINM
eukprot:1172479-Prymnesium_polylepis.1